MRLNATVLMREIQARGYDGGITQLKEFLTQIRPKAPQEPIIRFETEPGRQLQIDFVDFRRGNRRSALPPSWAIRDMPMSSLRTTSERRRSSHASNERLQFFGGVPKHILCDNPKTIVIERNAYGEGKHRFNSFLLDLAKHYGVTIKPCAPYRAQTKGKVERFHRYLRESFFAPFRPVSWNSSTWRPRIEKFAIWLTKSRTAAGTQRSRNARSIDSPMSAPASLLYPCRTEVNALSCRVRPRSPFRSPSNRFQHPLAKYEELAKEIAA